MFLLFFVSHINVDQVKAKTEPLINCHLKIRYSFPRRRDGFVVFSFAVETTFLYHSYFLFRFPYKCGSNLFVFYICNFPTRSRRLCGFLHLASKRLFFSTVCFSQLYNLLVHAVETASSCGFVFLLEPALWSLFFAWDEKIVEEPTRFWLL